MTSSRAWKRTLLASVISAGLVSASQSAFADVEGPGTFNGDQWQGWNEWWLGIESVAEFINEAANWRPFYVPQAKSHGMTTFRNRAIPVTLRAKHLDTDGSVNNRLIWTIVSGPKHGTLSGTAPNLVYTPDADYTGFDEIVFKVDDNVDGSTEGTIDIKVLGSYTALESGQVRPLALNSTGTRLYALNTPDGKLEIFDTSGNYPKSLHSVPVGLEPVAIALRNDNEAWIVNHASDNVSVVDLSAAIPHVKRTLHVGDEPQDVVFAGANGERAFITTAHRGQHSPSPMAPLQPGIDRADVWVFNAASNSNQPETIVGMFGMPPRGLAVSPDGKKVYAAIFKSGNKSTIAAHNYRNYGKTSTLNGKPGPNTDASGTRAPNTGVLVKHDGEHWRDYYGTEWDRQIYFDLPDYDVFEIDAMAATPAVTNKFSGVGNALLNIGVNPKSGALYVTNLEARNELKFEGHGERSDVQTLRGRFIENRVTVIKNGEVTPRDLNPHLSDENPDGSPAENALSLALPGEIVVDANGDNVYVAAYGSSKIGVLTTAELEAGSYAPAADKQIELSGGGPAGIVLDEAKNRMYVLTRFKNSITVVDLAGRNELFSVPMYNPEPDFITKGRKFLYDARFSSGRGDSACGSCHLFGDMDGIAWNLGNPDMEWSYNTRDYVNFFSRMNALRIHHPIKGPMLTQSLRGMEFQGPQHWRGDRTGSKRYNGESLEKAAFKEFRGAFTELLGRAEEPTEAELNQFADFVLQLRYPPNPNRKLDDTLTLNAQQGSDIYFNQLTTGFEQEKTGNLAMNTCNDCHEVNPEIERFGTSTMMSFEGTETTQDMKVAHLRNVYTRLGMFGQKFRSPTSTDRHMGPQVTGYGLSHDGAVDTLETFLSINVFHIDTPNIHKVLDFVTQMPTGLAPMVGQQVTRNATQPGGDYLIGKMIEQALAHTKAGGPGKPKCDLIVQGVAGGQAIGWLLQDSGEFVSDQGDTHTDAQLRQLALQAGNSLTWHCAPPGSGYRVALDRDEDGRINGQDPFTFWRKPTSVQPADPYAAPEIDEVVDADAGGYMREQSQKEREKFPDFTDFWAF